MYKLSTRSHCAALSFLLSRFYSRLQFVSFETFEFPHSTLSELHTSLNYNVGRQLHVVILAV